jgi:hypothetical protein
MIFIFPLWIFRPEKLRVFQKRPKGQTSSTIHTIIGYFHCGAVCCHKEPSLVPAIYCVAHEERHVEGALIPYVRAKEI